MLWTLMGEDSYEKPTSKIKRIHFYFSVRILPCLLHLVYSFSPTIPHSQEHFHRPNTNCPSPNEYTSNGEGGRSRSFRTGKRKMSKQHFDLVQSQEAKILKGKG